MSPKKQDLSSPRVCQWFGSGAGFGLLIPDSVVNSFSGIFIRYLDSLKKKKQFGSVVKEKVLEGRIGPVLDLTVFFGILFS